MTRRDRVGRTLFPTSSSEGWSSYEVDVGLLRVRVALSSTEFSVPSVVARRERVDGMLADLLGASIAELGNLLPTGFGAGSRSSADAASKSLER
mmetsp:Transcript_20165/g.31160  ORF Transcript_20165/g.31160 Transcript_20165/m.31160 type:complete len:94 (+) Transcript_20165:3330-3611(+)